MLPHDKLDWTLSRLERHLEGQPDDTAARTDLAVAALSRAWFHDGGEMWFNRALTEARRVLHHDPASARALVVAGAALAGLDRREPAARYLDEAVRAAPENPLARLALAELHLHRGERHQAVRELEFACREAPDAWEPHARLGLLLRGRAETLGHPPRVLERAQFHLVRAVELGPSAAWRPRLLLELALACLQTGRLSDAHKLLARLQDHADFRARARYHLGIVAMHMGKYKNAVLSLRQHLQSHGDNPHVHARIATCYLHLGEVTKAREACNRALALDPGHLDARWTLGCALLEEDRLEEAVRLFREILRDAPQHTPAFAELVRIRRDARDAGWLGQALRTEVDLFDRLPLEAEGPGGATVQPRAATRRRIRLLVAALTEVAEDPVSDLLDAVGLTTDEGLRAELWEAALEALGQQHAHQALRWLQDPGRWFGVDRGHEVLAVAPALPETALKRGLQLSEEDLQRAAVDRHGPARDVGTHRRRVESERDAARAWQALLLLALADRGSDTARSLLLRWTAEADEALATAARTGLALMGDDHALAALRRQAVPAGAGTAVDALTAALAPADDLGMPRPVSDDEDLTCATCGRRSGEVDHMMAGRDLAVCDRCLGTIARRRAELVTDDPTLRCALTGRGLVESRELYVFQGVPIAAEVVDRSLGLAEREAVDRFLAGW
jgi:tetratricopeptide (TPR) repeat protein